MKRITAILALFVIVGMAFAAGCSETPTEGGAPAEAGKMEGGKMEAGKAEGGEAAPPGPK